MDKNYILIKQDIEIFNKKQEIIQLEQAIELCYHASQKEGQCVVCHQHIPQLPQRTRTKDELDDNLQELLEKKQIAENEINQIKLKILSFQESIQKTKSFKS